jgi:hypothetical protein
LRAKAFFGFSGTVNIEAAAQLEKFLLSAMARPTFSAREVYTRAFIVPAQRIRFYAEDRHLAWQTLAGMNGVVSLKAFGDALAPAKPGADEARLGLIPYRPYSSIETWLMFMNRWASDLDGGRQALERCFEAFWKPKKRPGLGETFCTQGVVGDHYPTEDEVAAATLAVTGKSKYRDKTDNGRFTLNDGPARASLNPPLPPEWGKPGRK